MSNGTQTMGKRIAQLRKEKGWTQEQLAEKLGVSAQAVSKWENDISCPDITLLPLLASTLGVTTDELLGIEPIEPHVVVVENDSGKKKHDWEWSFDGAGKRGSIIFGCMLLLLGLIYLLSNIEGIPITTEGNFWWIVLSLFLLGVGISSFKKKFSFTGVGFILLSGYLFYVKVINLSANISFNIIWPIVVVLIALGIIFQVFTKRSVAKRIHRRGKEPVFAYKEDAGNIMIDCSFGDEKAECSLPEVRGADIDVSFGNYTLDLSKVETFSENCVFKTDVSFGSLVLIIPERVNIMKSVTSSFGSCTVRGNQNMEGGATIILKGDVSFGSIDIKRG